MLLEQEVDFYKAGGVGGKVPSSVCRPNPEDRINRKPCDGILHHNIKPLGQK